MGARLFSAQDVHKTLNGTVCLYRNEPVYVTAEGRSNIVQTQLLGVAGAPFVSVDHSDDDFDYSAPRLGYIFLENETPYECTYLRRRPSRQWRGGIVHQLVTTSTGNVANSRWFYSQAMAKCIKGEHLTYSEAMERVLNNTNDKVPFHRHYAVGKEKRRIALYHRDNIVGYFDPKIEKFRLLHDCGVSLVLLDLNKRKFGHIIA